MYLNSSAGITGINYGLQVFENCPSAFSKKKKDKYIDIFESFFFLMQPFTDNFIIIIRSIKHFTNESSLRSYTHFIQNLWDKIICNII